MAGAAGVRRIVVFGGNGLLGSSICRAAVRMGHEVTSISRRGMAPTFEPWTKKVEWHSGDALNPDSYSDLLRGAHSVVHTVGTLLEQDAYKRFLRRGDYARYNGARYEEINRDTALAVMETAIAHQVESMLYISAAAKPPGVDQRYIDTKREVERALMGMHADSQLRGIVFRPGYMFSEEEPSTMAIGAAMLCANLFTEKLQLGGIRNFLAAHMGAADDTALNPMNTTTVADAAMNALQQGEVSGILLPQDILELATNCRK
eukprot:m.212326 g.212326  ORF g.212326 m.212326 type:complete len:261 (+) comp19039_c0_seq1:355-1137(+)